MAKTFVGPQLRQLRRSRGHSQAEMARRLGISAAYVNLLESNQRSLSVQVLLALTEHYGADMRSLVQDADHTRLADLRAATRDPVLVGEPPDLGELRGALDHAPNLVDRFLQISQNYRSVVEQMQRLAESGTGDPLIAVSPETAIHDFFRDHGNHFDRLERAAERLRARIGGSSDDIYSLLKTELSDRHGLETAVVARDALDGGLRVLDDANTRVILSEALDHPNRSFQLAFVLGLLEAGEEVQALSDKSGLRGGAGLARLKVELTNYFAAATLMPYDAVFGVAESSGYDIDHIAARFGASFEQVCQRLTTLQRDGARGVPFFFLRVDRSGNVVKRFNATPFQLAERGGACPVWGIHDAFGTQGLMVPQFVELPEGARFFTLARSVERPKLQSGMRTRRLIAVIGCDIAHLDRLAYARPYNLADDSLFAPIGINCHLCARDSCEERAHEALIKSLPVDTRRRGKSRYES